MQSRFIENYLDLLSMHPNITWMFWNYFRKRKQYGRVNSYSCLGHNFEVYFNIDFPIKDNKWPWEQLEGAACSGEISHSEDVTNTSYLPPPVVLFTQLCELNNSELFTLQCPTQIMLFTYVEKIEKLLLICRREHVQCNLWWLVKSYGLLWNWECFVFWTV